MEMANLKRKLATILATDCVSFSKHMVQNEVLTLTSLKSCRALIDLIIDSHGGTIFHTAGDSVIAEFSSPVECVTAAIEFQEALATRNGNPDTKLKLEWRVGIHVDDVIIEGDNVFGNGVNIAARLESVAKPGQILVSRVVQEQVNTRIESLVRAVGTRALKNISEEFPVFAIGGAEVDDDVATPTKTPTQAMSVTDVITLNQKAKPKLAVMRFESHNPNEDSDFLVDGIFEDVITEFSMIKEISVVSRQSAVNAQQADQSIPSFTQEYGVDFLVTGSVRTSGKRVRITVELTDTDTGSVLWGKKFDRVLEDIFDVQDEIVSLICKSISGEIELSSLSRAKRKPTENMTSYELLLQGKALHHRVTAEASSEALTVFDKAIVADPENAQAYAWKACTMGQRFARGYETRSISELFPTFQALLDNAIAINSSDFECHRLLSAVNVAMENFDLAVQHGRRAYEMVPNDPRVLSGYGEALLKAGQYEAGLVFMLKALELEPVAQGQISADKRLGDAIFAHFLNNNYEQCIELFLRVEIPDFKVWLLVTVSSERLSLVCLESNWFKAGIQKFSDLNAAEEVKKFQVPDESIVKDLISETIRITALGAVEA